MPLTQTQKRLLETWLKKHKAPVDPPNCHAPAGPEMVHTPEVLTPTAVQERLLASWLTKQRKQSCPQRRQALIEKVITKAQEPPIEARQHALIKGRAPANPGGCARPGSHEKYQNPKWSDDTWFEKRYGDPGYYSRVKGL